MSDVEKHATELVEAFTATREMEAPSQSEYMAALDKFDILSQGASDAVLERASEIYAERRPAEEKAMAARDGSNAQRDQGIAAEIAAMIG